MNSLEPVASAPSAPSAPSVPSGPSVLRAEDAEGAARRHEQLAGLLLAARAGRRDALESIVTELSPLLWHTARAQGLDYESAQDAVQGTWLTLLRSLDQIHTPVALTSWLVTTVKRQAWRLKADRRSETPVEEASMAQIADPVPSVEEALLRNEREREVWRAVHELPARCQQLLRVVAFSYRPDYDQVAVALGMPRGSIGPTRGRCLDKLRRLMSAKRERSVS